MSGLTETLMQVLHAGVFLVVLFICMEQHFHVEYSDAIIDEKTFKQFRTLVVGIFSARENFELRQTIRETWLKEIVENNQSEKIEYRFVVGRMGCTIHPQNRKDPYSCKRQSYDYMKVLKDENLPLLAIEKCPHCFENDPRHGLVWNASVTVRHPVVIKMLGLHKSVLLTNKPATVQLYDINRDEVVVSARFSSVDPGILRHSEGDHEVLSNFRLQTVSTVLLPKYFEGILKILSDDYISVHADEEEIINTISSEGTGGVIDINEVDDTGANILSDVTNNLYMANILLTVHDAQGLKLIMQKELSSDQEQLEIQNEIDLRLDNENKVHNDILFVNLEDVYRNLPSKLLYFHHWVRSKFDAHFIMKTDDDCFVNIAEIISEIRTYLKTPHKVWWGHFRDNWYVERAGKWAEKQLRSSEYPSFACGSGNIVSQDISDWLTRNQEDLFQYQGEDTSMGIWLSAIQPTYVNDKRWLCEKGCEKNAFVVPQLSQDEIRWFWHNKVKCDNICGCI